MAVDMLFLDNHGIANFTENWKYYRVTPMARAHIEICEVRSGWSSTRNR